MKSCPQCAEAIQWSAAKVCYDCGHRFDGILSATREHVKAGTLILLLAFAAVAGYGVYGLIGARDATDEHQRIECIESDLSHRSDACK